MSNFTLSYSEPVERPSSLSEIAGSNGVLVEILNPNLKEFPKTWSPFYIDVRDCALAHARAAFAPKSSGNQRYLIAGPGVGINKMVYLVYFKFDKKIRELLIKHYPDRKFAPLSKEAEEEDPQQTFDATKAAKTFGIKFHTFDEVLKNYAEFVFSYDK